MNLWGPVQKLNFPFFCTIINLIRQYRHHKFLLAIAIEKNLIAEFLSEKNSLQPTGGLFRT
jgi:hypothetical protein